jgi:hypothetical protein
MNQGTLAPEVRVEVIVVSFMLCFFCHDGGHSPLWHRAAGSGGMPAASPRSGGSSNVVWDLAEQIGDPGTVLGVEGGHLPLEPEDGDGHLAARS